MGNSEENMRVDIGVKRVKESRNRKSGPPAPPLPLPHHTVTVC